MLIFIGYRRDDCAGHAGRLYDRLVERFGAAQVWRDLDAVAAGEDYVEAIRQKVARCDVLLALIGPRWLSAADADGRWRLADENDLVRVEIATALARNARVVPVLLQGAAMPREADLPGALAPLARRNAVQLRDSHFDHDADELAALLAPAWRLRWSRRLLRAPVYAAVALLLAAGTGAWLAPRLLQTPERARAQLAQLNLPFDARNFVKQAARGDALAVALYLQAGIAPDAEDDDGATAIGYAIRNGHAKVMRALLDGGASTAIVLLAAASYGRLEVLDAQLAGQVPVELLGRALLAAASSGQPEAARRLLDKGAPVDAHGNDGQTPLIRAAGVNDLPTVRLLLERRADVNAVPSDASGRNALHEALERASGFMSPGLNAKEQAALDDIVRALLDHGAPLEARASYGDRWKPTPLLHAIDSGHAGAATLLIERGADVHAEAVDTGEARSVNALMLTARRRLVGLVPALLGHGIDVNARNDIGESALLFALESNGVRESALPVVNALLAAGATLAPRRDGRGPLMVAAMQQDGEDVVQALLAAAAKSGAKVDATESEGWTALMFAAQNGRPETVRVLLAAGADRNLRNREGQTALMLARAQGHQRTTKALGG